MRGHACPLGPLCSGNLPFFQTYLSILCMLLLWACSLLSLSPRGVVDYPCSQSRIQHECAKCCTGPLCWRPGTQTVRLFEEMKNTLPCSPKGQRGLDFFRGQWSFVITLLDLLVKLPEPSLSVVLQPGKVGRPNRPVEKICFKSTEGTRKTALLYIWHIPRKFWVCMCSYSTVRGCFTIICVPPEQAWTALHLHLERVHLRE